MSNSEKAMRKYIKDLEVGEVFSFGGSGQKFEVVEPVEDYKGDTCLKLFYFCDSDTGYFFESVYSPLEEVLVYDPKKEEEILIAIIQLEKGVTISLLFPDQESLDKYLVRLVTLNPDAKLLKTIETTITVDA